MNESEGAVSSGSSGSKGGWSDERAVLLDEEAERRWCDEMSEHSMIWLASPEWDAEAEWIENWARSDGARSICAEWAAKYLGVRAEGLLSVSPPLRSQFAQRLFEACDAGPSLSVSGISPAFESEGRLDRESCAQGARLCADVLGWANGTMREPLSRWVAFAEIVPDKDRPAFLMDGRNDFPAALERGDRLGLLGFAIGLRVAPVTWREFLAGNRWDRCAARWRMATVIAEASADDPSKVEIPSEKTKRFVHEVVPAALPVLMDAAALISREKARGDEVMSGEARSAVEALLFAILEARPFTRGRFRLNAPLPFAFGLRPAEGDLAALEVRLVIEVDGYYHFRDAAAYRRDRRKDALLQEHGWFVLRFLAEDVACDLGDAVAQIERTLARRDTIRSNPKPTAP